MLKQNGRIPVGVAAFIFLAGVFIIFSLLNFPLDKSLIYVLVAVVFIVAFLNTDIALIIIILSMLLSPEIRTGGEIIGRNVIIRAEDIFLFVIFFGWLAKMAVNKELGLIKRTSLNSPMLIYFVICLVSSLFGIISGQIKFKSSFFYLLKYFEYFLIFFMVANNLRTVRQAKIFVGFMLFTCFVVCIIAWSQIPSGERLSAPFESEGGEPNTFAAYLLLLMGLVMGLLFHLYSRKIRFFLLALCALTLAVFVLTLSREGWLGFFPMFLTFAFLKKKLRLPIILVLIAAIFFLPALLPKRVHERVQDTFTPDRAYKFLGRTFKVSESAAARIDSWGEAMNRLSKRPVLGWGVPVSGVVDNQYTRVLMETGLAGFMAFMILIFMLFRIALRTYYGLSDDFSQGVSSGFLAGLIGLLVQSFGAAVFILVRVMEPFWFLAAIMVMLGQIKQEDAAPDVLEAAG